MLPFLVEAKIPVLHSAYVGGVLDANNVETETWADPVVHLTYGWATPGSDTEDGKWRTAVVGDLDLYSPDEFTGPKDKVTIKGKEYNVIGDAEDYNNGPFDFMPGFRINLKRAVDLG